MLIGVFQLIGAAPWGFSGSDLLGTTLSQEAHVDSFIRLQLSRVWGDQAPGLCSQRERPLLVLRLPCSEDTGDWSPCCSTECAVVPGPRGLWLAANITEESLSSLLAFLIFKKPLESLMSLPLGGRPILWS